MQTRTIVRSSFVFLAAAAVTALAGCSHDAPPPESPVTTTTETVSTTTTTSSAIVPTRSGDIAIDPAIVAQCKLHFDAVESTPRFGFDDDNLSGSDRSVLDDVAKCLTTGPLAGHAIGLVGRTDPRGEQEYNMNLGARRASAVATYLANLGVGADKVSISSRGKLDARGTTEDGWAIDRRCDLVLR